MSDFWKQEGKIVWWSAILDFVDDWSRRWTHWGFTFGSLRVNRNVKCSSLVFRNLAPSFHWILWLMWLEKKASSCFNDVIFKGALSSKFWSILTFTKFKTITSSKVWKPMLQKRSGKMTWSYNLYIVNTSRLIAQSVVNHLHLID